jgi:predicted DNA-binding transcriptional regulator AlpA
MKFVPLKQGLAELGISRSELYRQQNSNPKFPRIVKPLGPGTKRAALVDTEIEAYQKARIAERDSNTA